MTCIVGLKTDDGIYIGGDTFGSNGEIGKAYVKPKVFQNGEFMIGVCGSYRLMQILEFNLQIPPRLENQDDDTYLYVNFVNSVRNSLAENGALIVENGMEIIAGGDFIFAYRGRLFEFQEDFSILEPKCNYATTGSGSCHADASLYSTEGLDISPEDRVAKAIECAGNFVVSVNKEIDIIFQKYSEETSEKGENDNLL